MQPVGKDQHIAHGKTYELLVCQVSETGEYRIYVNTGGFGTGPIYTASMDTVDAGKATGTDIVAELIATAKDDISRNEFKDF